jgi:Meiotically up-regulated gene 113
MFFNQQPYIYVLRAPHPINGYVYKIGITNRTPIERLAEIQSNGRRLNDTSQHAQLYQYYSLHNAATWEKKLHIYYRQKQYKKIKGSGKTEWFRVNYPYYALITLKCRWLLEWLLCFFFWCFIACIFFFFYRF